MSPSTPPSIPPRQRGRRKGAPPRANPEPSQEVSQSDQHSQVASDVMPGSSPSTADVGNRRGRRSISRLQEPRSPLPLPAPVQAPTLADGLPVNAAEITAASSDVPVSLPIDSIKESVHFVQDILDKQYFNYTWCDGKVQVLMATDSIVGAAAAALVSFQQVPKSAVTGSLFAGALACVTASIVLCLRHAIPRLTSGKSGPANNLRAQTGITSLPNYRAYQEALRALTIQDRFDLTSRQAYGMAHNNRRSHDIIRLAAGFTMAASVFIAAALIVIALKPVFAKQPKLTPHHATPSHSSLTSPSSQQAESVLLGIRIRGVTGYTQEHAKASTVLTIICHPSDPRKGPS